MVCGITLLDKDHLHILGGTVESIAWHKAGIFKVMQLEHFDIVIKVNLLSLRERIDNMFF